MRRTYTVMLGDEEHDVTFNIHADISYQKAYISGPPEDCYPADESCEITDVDVLTSVQGFSDADLLDALEKQIGEERITDDLWDDYHDGR